jgi:hypothetical protein
VITKIGLKLLQLLTICIANTSSRPSMRLRHEASSRSSQVKPLNNGAVRNLLELFEIDRRADSPNFLEIDGRADSPHLGEAVGSFVTALRTEVDTVCARVCARARPP